MTSTLPTVASHDVAADGHRRCRSRGLRRAVAPVALVVVLGVVADGGAASIAGACATLELRALETRVAKMGCWVHAARHDRPVREACLAATDRRFERSWRSLGVRGCPARGRASIAIRLADDLVTSAVAEITTGLAAQPWGNRCAAVKLDWTRAVAAAALDCVSREPGAVRVVPCAARARATLRRRFRVTEVHVGCNTIGDALLVGAALERLVEESTAAVLPGVSFSRTVQPILALRCASGGCHSGRFASSGLDLSPGAAWTDLVDAPSVQCGGLRVDPANPADSYLLAKLARRPGPNECRDEAQMPPPGIALSEHERMAILRWILHGAPPG